MGRAPCCDKANVKKGPWSPEEDAKLKDFIEKSGTGGNWIALPQKAGLKRCGKSCRLRWLNYLRPNIKHGEFSEEEDRIICSLYATIGSRWSIIAGQLPGRTDNDIKNYWNTKLKKKLMGIIPSDQGKFSQPLSATFQTSLLSQSQSLFNLSQLFRDYTSIYSQATKSLTAIDQAPQHFLYSNANYSHVPLSTTTTSQYSYNYNNNEQNHEGLVDSQCYYNPVKENMLMFGGNETSCSSSDGSCGHITYSKDHPKQEEMGCLHQGFISNGFEENQKFMLHYGDEISEFLDQKANGILENSQLQYDVGEAKPLISTGNGFNILLGNNNLLSNDENKTHEKSGMYYY